MPHFVVHMGTVVVGLRDASWLVDVYMEGISVRMSATTKDHDSAILDLQMSTDSLRWVEVLDHRSSSLEDSVCERFWLAFGRVGFWDVVHVVNDEVGLLK